MAAKAIASSGVEGMGRKRLTRNGMVCRERERQAGRAFTGPAFFHSSEYFQSVS